MAGNAREVAKLNEAAEARRMEAESSIDLRAEEMREARRAMSGEQRERDGENRLDAARAAIYRLETRMRGQRSEIEAVKERVSALEEAREENKEEEKPRENAKRKLDSFLTVFFMFLSAVIGAIFGFIVAVLGELQLAQVALNIITQG